ncbi:MAG: hypothetical protein Ct9H300mP28_26680 [Pseudomonadota bacterium]|nr:MAG: hypothetical protein Ct9H300mP28_26680 [Pseudomonadota bacterium]
MKCTIYQTKNAVKAEHTGFSASKGLKPTIIEYLKNPPTKDELEEINIKLKNLS